MASVRRKDFYLRIVVRVITRERLRHSKILPAPHDNLPPPPRQPSEPRKPSATNPASLRDHLGQAAPPRKPSTTSTAIFPDHRPGRYSTEMLRLGRADVP